MIKISGLADQIGDESPFDRVLTLGMVSRQGNIGVMHLIQHYPRISAGIAEMRFDMDTGSGKVTHDNIKPAD